MLRTMLANAWSTKSDSLDFDYEFVNICGGNNINEYYLALSWMAMYVVNKGDWSKELKRDITAKGP